MQKTLMVAGLGLCLAIVQVSDSFARNNYSDAESFCISLCYDSFPWDEISANKCILSCLDKYEPRGPSAEPIVIDPGTHPKRIVGINPGPVNFGPKTPAFGAHAGANAIHMHFGRLQ